MIFWYSLRRWYEYIAELYNDDRGDVAERSSLIEVCSIRFAMKIHVFPETEILRMSIKQLPKVDIFSQFIKTMYIQLTIFER